MNYSPEISPLSPRKEQILKEAQRLFSDKGYVAASMRDLADALQIKPASLYSHYRSKEEILWEIAIRSAEEFHQQVLPIAQGTGGFAERLEKMVRAHIEVVLRNIDASAIFFIEWKHLTGKQYERYEDKVKTYRKTFEGLLEAGIEAGEFRPVKHFNLTTRAFLASLDWVHRWYKADKEISPDALKEELAAFVLQGIAK
jgi:TetR/AcrR family transcriptional regulator, cholesterol catabolism regulator